MAAGLRIPDNLYDRVADAPWVIGRQSTPGGEAARVAADLGWSDNIGSWRARWGINRMQFMVEPGLYCTGEPDANSPVLVTANYKMSFDRLRRELVGIQAWILVLDTEGVNVWCAAGKGTFGTAELVRRIARVGLDKVVRHRTLILPQLGATGVAAYEVRKRSGFRVIYGPVRAEDLPGFLRAGLKAQPEMRQVRFDIWDRLVLTPTELRAVFTKSWLWALVLVLLAAHLSGLIRITTAQVLAYAGAVAVGTILTPALLPWIPGRAFAWKGFLLGLIWALVVLSWPGIHDIWADLGVLLIVPAVSSFLALQFTGASTYTSFSGVIKETRLAVPLIRAAVGLGLAAFIIGLV